MTGIQWLHRLLVVGAVGLGLLLGGALLYNLTPGTLTGSAVPDGGTVGVPPSPSRPAATRTALPPSPMVIVPRTARPTLTATARPPATATVGATPTLLATATTTPGGTPTVTPIPPETPQPDAWRSRSTAHFDLYYLPDSPAARDIDQLARLSETAMTQAAARLQAPPNTRIRIYFVNRIFWQGGASYPHNELLLSYVDRDYTATSLARVLQHETTHALVEQLLGSALHKGGLLGEGVAVWGSGGHYQTEPLATLASTLVGDNAALYLPLADLRHDFAGAQHELAYLEGGAYVEWLVERWGLPQFKRYLDQPDDPQPIYGLDSAGMETAWRGWLAAQPHSATNSAAVRLRVRYYDLMRHYEVVLDTNARLLPDPPPSRWGPTLLGLFRDPATAPLNVALESDFVQAGAALWAGDLPLCGRLLDSIAARIP